MKIAVAGAGYVGLSNAVLLAQHHDVMVVDVVAEKVERLNRRESPIVDVELQDYLQNKSLRLQATLDKQVGYAGADYVIVATPTDYDPVTNHFDTSLVEAAIKDVQTINPTAVIVIKSTVPVGYTARLSESLSCDNVIFHRNSCEKARHCTTICTLSDYRR